jgi:hypothetical protein
LGGEVTMSMEQMAAVENLMAMGFTPREADFLYLVGTHSGVFTSQQYCLASGGVSRGGTPNRLRNKLDKLKFITRIALTQQHQFFHLSNKIFYRAILTEDSRLRRGMSASLIRQRLQYTDYLVRNTDARYLTSEDQKRDYLIAQFGISESLIPRQVYHPKQSGANKTVRLFPERFPMFITEESGYAGLGVVYGEDPANRFACVRRFVVANKALFASIPFLHFVYVSASAGRARLTSALLSSVFGATHTVQNDDLKRYFELRRKYDNNERHTFTDSDYAFWSRAYKQYNAAKYEPLYAEFIGQKSLPAVSFVVPRRSFAFTHFVPTTTLREGLEVDR